MNLSSISLKLFCSLRWRVFRLLSETETKAKCRKPLPFKAFHEYFSNTPNNMEIIWFPFCMVMGFFLGCKSRNTRCIVVYIMCVFKTGNMVFLIWLWKQVFIFASMYLLFLFYTTFISFYSSISPDFCQHLCVEHITILIKFKWKTVKIFFNIYTSWLCLPCFLS